MKTDPKTLDLATLKFMLEYLKEQRACYVNKFGGHDTASMPEFIAIDTANDVWRDTMDDLIEWTEKTVSVVAEKTKRS